MPAPHSNTRLYCLSVDLSRHDTLSRPPKLSGRRCSWLSNKFSHLGNKLCSRVLFENGSDIVKSIQFCTDFCWNTPCYRHMSLVCTVYLICHTLATRQRKQKLQRRISKPYKLSFMRAPTLQLVHIFMLGINQVGKCRSPSSPPNTNQLLEAAGFISTTTSSRVSSKWLWFNSVFSLCGKQ